MGALGTTTIAGTPLGLGYEGRMVADAFGWRSAYLLLSLASILIVWLIWRDIRKPVANPTAKTLAVPRSSLVSIVTRQIGLSSQAMNYVMAMIGAAGAVSAPVMQGLSDRIRRKPAIAIFSAGQVIAPLAAVLLGGSPWLVGSTLFVGPLFGVQPSANSGAMAPIWLAAGLAALAAFLVLFMVPPKQAGNF